MNQAYAVGIQADLSITAHETKQGRQQAQKQQEKCTMNLTDVPLKEVTYVCR
jgi:hypothetical protein